MGRPFLNADAIRQMAFVRHIEIYDTLGSTNDRAAQLAHEIGIGLPALVVARRQTAGRGRGQNRWWSAGGALTFSLLIEPAALGINTANWPQLSLATAVAVCDALQNELNQRAGASPPPAGLEDEPAHSHETLGLGIKWPNDVMLDSRKVAGILIESPGGAAPAKDRLIIGIGMNVNNTWLAAPSEVEAIGTTLIDATGTPHELQRVLIRVLQAMRQRLAQLGGNDPAVITAWQQRCALSGKCVQLEAGRDRVEGACRGIAVDGAIIIDTATGRRSIYSGTVRAVT